MFLVLTSPHTYIVLDDADFTARNTDGITGEGQWYVVFDIILLAEIFILLHDTVTKPFWDVNLMFCHIQKKCIDININKVYGDRIKYKAGLLHNPAVG